MKAILLLTITCSLLFISSAQLLNNKQKFTRQDTLRGSIGAERAWWNVLRYDLRVTPDYDSKTIIGKNTITYNVLSDEHSEYIQIDLQQPLRIDTIYYDNRLYINYPRKPYYNEGNVWHIPLPKSKKNSVHSITICYSGKPREAKNPPWDGGWIWKRDEKNRPWMSVACQGLGASVWYPCKDHQSDEPDQGASLTITVADSLVAVGNGKLKERKDSSGYTSWTWEVKNPINNYNIIPYIGKYVNWNEEYTGGKGKLDCDFWVLDYDLEKAKKQFGRDVKPMLKCFEDWFGPFPFYEDGFKLVESPHLGMEHQSAVAYGNKFMNGYLGNDLSGSGWGLKWDFIIIHESGHEWWGNNITTNDIADMWVHEGFTCYSETIFTECLYGKAAADAYCQGIRKNIDNDKPIISLYGVNQEGSGDMYNKGANMIHTIRQVINDDVKFKEILRGLNLTFYHKTITSKQLEEYFTKQSGKDLSKIFDQYLRTTQIPVLEYKIEKNILSSRWTNCINNFNMPVRLANSNEWLTPTTKWQQMNLKNTKDSLEIDRNFYVTIKRIK